MVQAIDSQRRQFLVSSAAVGASLLIGFNMDTAHAAVSKAGFRPNAFLNLDADGTVTVFVPNTEIGQGSLTALSAIVAEELDVEWPRVRAEQAPAHPDYAHPWFNIQMTGASSGTASRWDQLRKAGAIARELLVAAAAGQWNVAPAACRAEQGLVHGPEGKVLSYGELAAAAGKLAPPENIRLKQRSAYKLLGRDLRRVDSPDKVTGRAVYGIDVRLPGMLTAVVERPPTISGKMKSFDPARALAVPGVKQVVPVAGGVAVIAAGFWAAQKGREQLRVVWDAGAMAEFSTESLAVTHRKLVEQPGIEAARVGDVASVSSGKWVEASYEVPYLAHACMEPMNCTAWVKEDSVELWAPTQAQGINQIVVSKMLGIKPEQVKIVTTYAGGGFGRRAAQDFVIDAVLASKAAGAPVQLIYSREDDMRSLYYRPAALGHLSAVLNEAGALDALTGRVVCSSAYGGAGYNQVFRGPLDPGSVEGLADLPYKVPNLLVDWVRHEPGVQVFTWRSVGQSFVVYFVESFIDELAHAAGADPLRYRLDLLKEKSEHRRALEKVAQEVNWGQRLPAGRGLGLAICEDRGYPIALAVEASMEDGAIKIHRMVSALDCGFAINPALVRAQVTSSLVFGLSAALDGEITIRDGRVQQSSFEDYPVLRMSECPPMAVHLLDSAKPPGGVGEIAVPLVAPALCNALFAATGRRIRTLPLRART